MGPSLATWNSQALTSGYKKLPRFNPEQDGSFWEFHEWGWRSPLSTLIVGVKSR